MGNINKINIMSYNASVSKIESKIDTDNVPATYSMIEEQRRKSKIEITDLPNDLAGSSTYSNTINKSKLNVADKKLKYITTESIELPGRNDVKRKSIAITDIINKRNTRDNPDEEGSKTYIEVEGGNH